MALAVGAAALAGCNKGTMTSSADSVAASPNKSSQQRIEIRPLNGVENSDVNTSTVVYALIRNVSPATRKQFVAEWRQINGPSVVLKTRDGSPMTNQQLETILPALQELKATVQVVK